MNPVINEMITLFKDKDWTKHKFARDINGEPVHPRSPEAISFCLAGAFDRVQTKYSTYKGRSSYKKTYAPNSYAYF